MEDFGEEALARAAIKQLTEIEPGLTITEVRKVCAHWPLGAALGHPIRRGQSAPNDTAWRLLKRLLH